MAEFNGLPLVRTSSKRAWEPLCKRRSFYPHGQNNQRYYVNRGIFATPVAADGRTPTDTPVPAKTLLDPARKPPQPAYRQAHFPQSAPRKAKLQS